MREIKFRCWNPVAKHMTYEVGYHPHYAQDEDSVKIIAPFLEFPIMQFTGLKDKNGREIYEDDEIKTPAGIGIVKWIDGCHRILWYGAGNTTLYDCQTEHLEIIGNIHESPLFLNPKEQI